MTYRSIPNHNDRILIISRTLRVYMSTLGIQFNLLEGFLSFVARAVYSLIHQKILI